MEKILLFALIVVFSFVELNAQQDPQYTMYMFNGQYINPGYVGSRGVADMTGLYRYQWAGQNFDGSPQSMSIGLNTPFKKDQYAIGVYTGYDHIGFVDMYNLIGQFAYRIPVKKSKISLGMQAGFYHYKNKHLYQHFKSKKSEGRSRCRNFKWY